MAAWWMADGGPRDGPCDADQFAGIRSVLFDGEWYRDYVAYCGVSDDGKKLFAIVAQLGRRKPILKKPVGEPDGDEMPDSECPAPTWQRQPSRVTFQPDEEQKLTYSVRGHAVDAVVDTDEDEDGE